MSYRAPHSARIGRTWCRRFAQIVMLTVLSACTPKMTVLTGTEFTGALPKTDLVGHRMLNFNWRYQDSRQSGRGVGRISLSAPDSLRLDLEMQGGQVSAYALLFGAGPINSNLVESVMKMLPSPELVWAAAGRLAVPPAGDTLKRIEEGVVRADIGSDPKWRATFDGSRLVSVEKAVKGKRVERVTRGQDGTVTYVRGNSSLKLTEVKDSIVAAFPREIWRN